MDWIGNEVVCGINVGCDNDDCFYFEGGGLSFVILWFLEFDEEVLIGEYLIVDLEVDVFMIC